MEEEILAALQSLKEAGDLNSTRTELRFDAMDRRFDAMDRRFDRVDLRLGRLETRVEYLEDGQTAIRTDLTDLKHIVGDLAARGLQGQ